VATVTITISLNDGSSTTIEHAPRRNVIEPNPSARELVNRAVRDANAWLDQQRHNIANDAHEVIDANGGKWDVDRSGGWSARAREEWYPSLTELQKAHGPLLMPESSQ